MEVVTEILALIVLVGLVVMIYGGAIAALLAGRKLPWIWFALAMFELVTKIVSVALYREVDSVRGIAALSGAVLAAVLALLVQRRFGNVVLVVGGFLATGLIVVQVLGPLLNPAPEWLVLGLMVATGVAGAIWARANPSAATIVFSALVGAGILADTLVDTMGIDEAHRFQVYALLALIGVGVQVWTRRREQGAALPQAQGD